MIEQCLQWEQRRGGLDFEIDGVVVKVSDLELQRRLGSVGRDPRWAVAWKFAPTTAVTKLRSIGWNPGRSGDLHPFAILDPVSVGGVTIKLATLHNEEDLLRKDIREGEDVIVLRAGDVIPQVISPAPARGGATSRGRRARARRSAARSATRRRSSPRAQCSRAAPTANARSAAGSCSSTSFRAAGWTSRASARSRSRCSSSRTSFARRRTSTACARSSCSRSSALRRSPRATSCSAIEASKERPFARVLFALGIEEVGEITAQNLAQQFGDIDALLAAPAEQIASTPGIGEKTAKVIREQLDEEQMQALIEDLRELGLRFAEAGACAVRRAARGQHARASPGRSQSSRASRRRSASARPAGALRARSPGIRITSSPAPLRARSSRRPSGSASR